MSVGAGKAAAPPAGGLTPGRRNLCAQSSWRAHTLDWWGGLIDLPNVESFAAPPTRPSRFPHSTGSLSRHRRTATPLPVTRRPIGTFIRAPSAHVAPTIGIRATRRPRRLPPGITPSSRPRASGTIDPARRSITTPPPAPLPPTVPLPVCGNPFPSRTASPTPRTAGRPPAMTTPRRRTHRRRPPQPRGRTSTAPYSSPVCFSRRALRGAVTTGFGRGIAPDARQQRSPARQRRSSLPGFSSPPTPLPIATSSRRLWRRKYPRHSPHHTPRRKRR